MTVSDTRLRAEYRLCRYVSGLAERLAAIQAMMAALDATRQAAEREASCYTLSPDANSYTKLRTKADADHAVRQAHLFAQGMQVATCGMTLMESLAHACLEARFLLHEGEGDAAMARPGSRQFYLTMREKVDAPLARLRAAMEQVPYINMTAFAQFAEESRLLLKDFDVSEENAEARTHRVEQVEALAIRLTAIGVPLAAWAWNVNSPIFETGSAPAPAGMGLIENLGVMLSVICISTCALPIALSAMGLATIFDNPRHIHGIDPRQLYRLLSKPVTALLGTVDAALVQPLEAAITGIVQTVQDQLAARAEALPPSSEMQAYIDTFDHAHAEFLLAYQTRRVDTSLLAVGS